MAELNPNKVNFGFGCMRFPKKPGTQEFDMDQIKKMVDLFLESGFVYFDTAYAYPGSEQALKEALVDRYSRDKFMLATKMSIQGLTDPEEAKKRIYVSLERMGTDYIDYYLIHNVAGTNIEFAEKAGLWDYVKELKEKGVIRHYGFSTHASPEQIDEILTKHPDAEFVQLQVNYMDWDSEDIQSRKCVEVAKKHGKPIIVMEPCKGGLLANTLPEDAQKVFKDVRPDRSVASWAFRYAASQEGIRLILSGMSTLEQVEDNMTFMKDVEPLSDAENQAVEKVLDVIKAIPQIQCTGCSYCTADCPKGIPTPRLFSVYNRYKRFPSLEDAKFSYDMATREKGKAGDCIGCGLCEDACPQHLPIRALLKEAADLFE